MPSTYTTNNGIELIGTGEQSGTWGETTNTNFGLIDTALDGQVTKTLASAGTSGSPNTLIIEDGTTSDGRNRLVIFNDGSDLGATAYVQLTPDNAEKIMFVRNSLSGDRSIIFFQGTYNASNDFELPNGTDAIIKFDGAGTGAVVEAVFKKLYLQDLLLDTSSAQTMYIESTVPTFNMKETDADLNEKFWRLQTSAGVFKVDAVNDAYDTAATAYSVNRSGVTPNLHIWYSNASEAMRVTSAGSVGINVSNPTSKLTVGGDAGVKPAQFIQGADTINDRIILAQNTGGQNFGTYVDAGTVRHLVAGQDDVFTTNGNYITLNTNNGVERLRIDASGNVGIGTSDPDANLEIDAGSATGTQLQITTTGSGHNFDMVDASATARIRNVSGSLRLYADEGNEAADSHIDFLIDNSEKMRITAAGNVGIGTSSPSGKLHVDGGDVYFTQNTHSDVFITATTSTSSRIWFGDTDSNTTASIQYSNAEDSLKFATNGNAERMRINASGYVGIGDTDPPTILSVRGETPESRITNTNAIADSAGTEEVARLGVYGQKNNVYGPAANIVFRQDASTWSAVDQYYKGTRIEFCTQDATATDTSETPRMVIDRDGFVGIGTSNPNAKLEIATNDESSILRLTDTATIGAVNRKVGGIEFYQSDASGGAAVNSSIQSYHTNISGATDLRFYTGDNSERVRITSSGSVGIGTSSPGATLDVRGTLAVGTSGTEGGQIDIRNPDGAAIGGTIDISAANAMRIFQTANSSALSIGQLGGTGGTIRFYTEATERMRITAAGQAIIPGGVTLGTAAGTYNAANTLDDYEEGTWTPEFVPAIGSLGSITYGIQAATYTKVGRQVTVTGRFQVTGSVTIGTASTAMRISGLPFAVGSGEAFYAAAGLSYVESWTAGNAPSSAYVANNSTVIQLRIRNSGADGPETNMTPSEFVSGADGGCSLMFSATYFTA